MKTKSPSKKAPLEKCKYCGHTKLWLRHKAKGAQSNAKYQCPKCYHYQSAPPRHQRTAKILLLDIETLYMEVRGIWNLKTEYIQPDRVVKDWSILCYGAKWLFEPKVVGASVTPKEAVAREDGSIIAGLWKFLDEADIVVTQNGREFDIKKINTKFLKYGFPPPSFYSVVDTLKVAREKFGFTSNRLDELGKHILGIGGKIKMSMPDWDACAEGSQAGLDKMFTYCKRDVAPLLEDLYLKFLPWIPNHPNLAIYTDHDKDVCPRCESTDLSWSVKYPTPQGMYEGFRCSACGAIGRGTTKIHRVKKVSIKAT